jgi:integrase
MRPPKEGAPSARFLTDAELKQLWNALPEALPRSKATQQIIKLCLLTGQRVGEVAGIHSNELDLRARTWTIPAARSKNGYLHEVPLSDAALVVIREAEGKTFLFPDRKGDAGLTSHEVSKTIRRAQSRFGLAQWTAHDLRRTVVTGMARLGVTPIVLGHCINHRSVTKAGVTLSVYCEYDYAREKREALDLWAAHLHAIVRGGAKVLPLRANR